MASKPIDHVIAIPTFIGSALSFLASAAAIGLQIARPPRRHFRHALIFNLLLSDFTNSLGNTISGLIFLAQGRTLGAAATPDTACIVSGWVNQISVQTIDFNILIISIIVLLSVLKIDKVSTIPQKGQILVCILAWLPGLITSNVALGLNAYGYVSGNWCWIRADRLVLRYSLTHGWRILIFFATIIIYTYIYIRLKKTFSTIRNITGLTTSANQHTTIDNEGHPTSDTERILISQSVSVSYELQTSPNNQSSSSPDDFAHSGSRYHSTASEAKPHMVATPSQPQANSRTPAPPNLRKMLLMNGYPIAYIILWIPGIANRLAESVGVAPRWLSALQASTQYVGLVNALTYGISEQMRREVWKKLGNKE